MTRLILVTYDIKEDRRRTKIANELKNFGTRVQYSVFECLLDRKQSEELQKKILTLLDVNEDSVRYYHLCEDCHKKIDIQGMGEITEDQDMWIL